MESVTAEGTYGNQGYWFFSHQAVDRDVGLSGKVVYSLEKQQDTSL